MVERGMCSICWKVDTVTPCSVCGRPVCRSCIDRSSGICKSCNGGRKFEADNERPEAKPDSSVEEFNSLL